LVLIDKAFVKIILICKVKLVRYISI